MWKPTITASSANERFRTPAIELPTDRVVFNANPNALDDGRALALLFHTREVDE
jgi:hypothetical protein